MSTVSGWAEPYLIFDCPSCGQHHEGPLRVTASWDAVRVYPTQEVAPGMAAEVLAAQPRIVIKDRRVTTSACRCVFSRRRWHVDVDFDGPGKPGRLVVEKLPGAEYASAASPGTG
jgi:hypothetical protein